MVLILVVTLYTRVWIEIANTPSCFACANWSPSTRGCGLKWFECKNTQSVVAVTLYTRVWIEIVVRITPPITSISHPLHEGVD